MDVLRAFLPLNIIFSFMIRLEKIILITSWSRIYDEVIILNSVIANDWLWGGTACSPQRPQLQGFPTGGWVQRGRTGSMP